MKTLVKYLLALVSPVLAYFAYFGNIGASNLLYAWTGLGLVMTGVFALFAGLLAFCTFFFNENDKEKHKETLEKTRQEYFKLRKFTLHTFIDIGCMVFYAWVGWWVVFLMEFVQFFIIKGIAFLTPESID